MGAGQAGRARSGGPRGASRSGCHGESPAEELSDAEAHASADQPEDAVRGAKRSIAAAAAGAPCTADAACLRCRFAQRRLLRPAASGLCSLPPHSAAEAASRLS